MTNDFSFRTLHIANALRCIILEEANSTAEAIFIYNLVRKLTHDKQIPLLLTNSENLDYLLTREEFGTIRGDFYSNPFYCSGFIVPTSITERLFLSEHWRLYKALLVPGCFQIVAIHQFLKEQNLPLSLIDFRSLFVEIMKRKSGLVVAVIKTVDTRQGHHFVSTVPSAAMILKSTDQIVYLTPTVYVPNDKAKPTMSQTKV